MYKVKAEQNIYLFKTGPIVEGKEDIVYASYNSRLGETSVGSIKSIDSKVEDIAKEIGSTIRWVLGKFDTTVKVYNQPDPRMIEAKNDAVSPLPEEVYQGITEALKKYIWKGLVIE